MNPSLKRYDEMIKFRNSGMGTFFKQGRQLDTTLLTSEELLPSDAHILQVTDWKKKCENTLHVTNILHRIYSLEGILFFLVVVYVSILAELPIPRDELVFNLHVACIGHHNFVQLKEHMHTFQ